MLQLDLGTSSLVLDFRQLSLERLLSTSRYPGKELSGHFTLDSNIKYAGILYLTPRRFTL